MAIKQKYTSANTSINSVRLPAIYRLNFQNKVVLDYGCGKYTEHLKKFSENNNCTWFGYDKFNQSEENNQKTLKYFENNLADIVICSNVLNVVAEDEIVLDIVRNCLKYTKEYAVFSVYEGNRSNIGKTTNKDCYQRNETKLNYLKKLKDNGFDAKIQKGFIFVRK